MNDSKHVGLHPYRLRDNPREQEFAEAWHDENKHGHTLEYILSVDNRRIDASDHDSMVAATIIQWLGTNVGFYFLRRVLDKCGYEIKQKAKR